MKNGLPLYIVSSLIITIFSIILMKNHQYQNLESVGKKKKKNITTAHTLHTHGMYFQVINFGNFSWCNNIDPYDISCYLMPSVVSKCPKEDLGLANPDYPLMSEDLFWGCKYNATKDKYRQNLKNPIKKDMISVWRRSWVVIRIKPINPGFWLFHCHVEQHIPLGMVTVLNVLESQQKPVPNTVPTEGPCPLWLLTIN